MFLIECDWNERTAEALPQIKHKPLSNLQLTTIDRSQIRADANYQLAARRDEEPMTGTTEHLGADSPKGVQELKVV